MTGTADHTVCRHAAKAGVHHWPSIEAFLADPLTLSDGVHSIDLGGGPHLDVLFMGGPTAAAATPVSVFFNAAISKRREKFPPFFSGVSVASRVPVPLIAFSDPTLQISTRPGLAWYAGNRRNGSIQAIIVRILTALHAATGRHLWLLGGSGGGFAALQAGNRLGRISSVFVFNPQTNILEYIPKAVANYVHSAFGVPLRFVEQPDWRDRAVEVFREHNIAWDLCDLPGQDFGPRDLIYLQNWNDWSHVERHLAPFVQRWLPGRSSEGRHVREFDGHHHVVAQVELGEGHAAPKPEVVSDMLKLALSGRLDAAHVVDWALLTGLLDRRHPERYGQDLSHFAPDIQAELILRITHGAVVATLRNLPDDFGALTVRYLWPGQSPQEAAQAHSLGAYVQLPDGVDLTRCRASVFDRFGHTVCSRRLAKPLVKRES